MMNRREKREAVFLFLYQSILNDDTVDEIAEAAVSEFEIVANDTELDEIVGRTKAVIINSYNADEIITKYSRTRKIERIPKIIIAIMRIALYEMDRDENVPDKVAINEAIELCKKYADKQDRGFVSGLLGSYFREKTSLSEESGDNISDNG